jgi:hypothetical protein
MKFRWLRELGGASTWVSRFGLVMISPKATTYLLTNLHSLSVGTLVGSPHQLPCVGNSTLKSRQQK